MDGPIIERQEKLGRTADNLRAAPEPDPAGRTTTARALQECSVAWVYDVLDSRPNGLTPEEAEVRRARYGPNSIQESPRKPLWLRLLANFTHLMAVLLWIGGIVAFLAQLPQLGVAIWLVVVVNGVFSFWQEYKAERATVALRRLLPSYSRVVRGGIEQRVRAEELVPGDIILLTEGEHISADARLVAQTELRVDQSTLSGESRAVHKTAEAVLEHETVNGDIPNLVFAGTSVAAGRGKAVVYATGMGTAFGKIAHLTQSVAQELSPIQKEMIHVTRVVTFFAIASGVVFFALGLGLGHMGLMNSFIFMMGMIVAFVPRGYCRRSRYRWPWVCSVWPTATHW